MNQWVYWQAVPRVQRVPDRPVHMGIARWGTDAVVSAGPLAGKTYKQVARWSWTGWVPLR